MAKKDLINRIIGLTILILSIVALRVWFFEPVTITKQMANEYLKKDDIIIAVKNAKITHGDFVLYKVNNKEYVGRVIALEGDTVTYMDDVLYRNNEVVTEMYLTSPNHQEYYTGDLTVSDIKEKQYLILNDIRTNNQDSRSFGLISSKQIIGRLTFRISPISEFGFIDVGLAQK